MIELKNLHKYFDKGAQNEIHVINDVTLSLPDTGMVAVFGKSGCGKTTLLNVIGGLDGFDSGTLTVGGAAIDTDADAVRNEYIGYIFQNYNLHHGETCFENVAAALRLCGMTDENEIARRVRAALTNVGMEKYEKRTPDTLSGGQQQRVAIARAIVKNPRIILADEPTGNLDEANTVLIMDLLKRISHGALVLLVTHEANLVDHYCDTVIELSDGAVVSVRENHTANGYVARDKNHIYLGELPKTELSGANAALEYYGEPPAAPIRIKLVNHGGKLYCRIDTEAVQVLDSTGETRLLDGVFEESAAGAAAEEQIDMSALPPVSGTRHGKLFTFLSSLAGGYRANFCKTARGKKMLVGCLCLFAAALVTMSAVFGTSIKALLHAREAYNHHVFYVYTPNAEVSQVLNAATEAESGIDALRLSSLYPDGDERVWFYPGNFETFGTTQYISGFETNAVYLDARLAAGLTVVAGKGDIGDDEMLITTAVANKLLEGSSLGYISTYEDLLGLICNSFAMDNSNVHLAGVVESRETAVYVSELMMARYVLRGMGDHIALATDFGLATVAGEVIIAVNGKTKDEYTTPTVLVSGRELQVREVRRNYATYPAWLTAKGLERLGSDAYFEAAVKAADPTLDPASADFAAAKQAAATQGAYEYLAYYYEYFERYLADLYFFERDDLHLYIFCEKGVAEMKYFFMNTDAELFYAERYKAQHGRYPTVAELEAAKKADPLYYEDYYSLTKQYAQQYEESFDYRDYVYFPHDGALFLLSESDYIAASRLFGATTGVTSYVGTGSIVTEGADVLVQDMDIHYDGSYLSYLYTVVHSNDPEKTAAWLESTFPALDTGDEYLPAILTPDGVFRGLTKSIAAEIAAGLVAMAVVLVLMSVCMYFIMRSSLMNRIKEVGIWRAIGVSRRNLVFRFFVEALVLTALTVLVGYLCSSLFLAACFGLTPLMGEVFFYPVWLALAVLAVLVAISLLCGTLPILLLLKKSPAEILAKYDI